jgi:hypothetical protein
MGRPSSKLADKAKRGGESVSKRNLRFSEIEQFVFRAASLLFLVLLLIKLFIIEVSSW